MIEEIVNLLTRYKDKVADSNFVFELVNIVVDNKNLEDYVKIVNINKRIIGADKELSLMTAAEYYVGGQNINLYIDGLIYHFDSMKKFFNNYSNRELIFCINLNVLALILHELEHANQYKIAAYDCDSFESKLIESSIQKSCELSDEDICFLYIYDPIERLADFYSYNICIKVSKYFKQDYPNVYFLMKFFLFNKLYDGYKYSMEFDKSPLEKYIDLSEMKLEWKDLVENKEMAFIDKLKYGLPIKRDEFNSLKIKLNNTVKVLEYRNRLSKF